MEAQLHEFDKYISLINSDETNRVQNFLQADPPKSYEEYCKLAQYYDQLSKNIPKEFDQTIFMNLFEVRRHYIIDDIALAAINLRNNIISKMVAEYQQKVRE